MEEKEECIKCGEEVFPWELSDKGHCPSCKKEHTKMESRLEARVERLQELIDHIQGEVDCFIGDFNDSLDDEERPQMLKDIATFEKHLRASGKALTHLTRFSTPDWIRSG